MAIMTDEEARIVKLLSEKIWKLLESVTDQEYEFAADALMTNLLAHAKWSGATPETTAREVIRAIAINWEKI